GRVTLLPGRAPPVWPNVWHCGARWTGLDFALFAAPHSTFGGGALSDANADTGSSEVKVDILLVDDQPTALLAMEATLGELGQNLVKATSASEALRHLLRRDFAVILLDVMMPIMDGFELARLIRARERMRKVPIIFLTALAGDVVSARAYSLGAVD